MINMRKAIPVVMLALCLILSGCSTNGASSSGGAASSGDGFDISSADSSDRSEGQEAMASSLPESEETEESEEAGSPQATVTLTVEDGEYLKEILEDLVRLGVGPDSLTLLERLPEAGKNTVWYREISGDEKRALSAEGYILPGTYEWAEGTEADRILSTLLSSSDSLEASEDSSVDQILTIASIITLEGSRHPDPDIYAHISSVIWNRINGGMQLQMDVTQFYLEDALLDGQEKETYAPYYDTYQTEALPEGPICSPSQAAIEAALHPADTSDLFFFYDEEGNYYFSEDYETHEQRYHEVTGN